MTVDLIELMQLFNGRLYIIGTRVLVDTATYARIYYYDGATFTEDFSMAGASYQSGIEGQTVHNGSLYAVMGFHLPDRSVTQFGLLLYNTAIMS